jgi:hypothetical protein
MAVVALAVFREVAAELLLPRIREAAAGAHHQGTAPLEPLAEAALLSSAT